MSSTMTISLVVRKQVYRVVLRYNLEMTRSVFIRATSRSEAERIALKRYRDAIGIERTMYPIN